LNGLERPAGRPARLGVPRLQLARPAGQPQQEDVLVLLADLAGSEAVDRRAESRQADAQRRGDAALEEQPPVEYVLRRATGHATRFAHDFSLLSYQLSATS